MSIRRRTCESFDPDKGVDVKAYIPPCDRARRFLVFCEQPFLFSNVLLSLH